jgi:hypothetical protein
MRPPPFVFARTSDQRCKVAVRKRPSEDSPQEIPSHAPTSSRLASCLSIGLALAVFIAQEKELLAEDGQPRTVSSQYSPYEQASIDQALVNLGAELDPMPDGKTVERIEVVALDVIEKRDPAPGILNALHATTQRYVIAREVLMSPGDPYRGVLCDETARNLRQLPQLSLVLCSAIRGHSSGTVRVLVITKDVWSLRLGWDVVYVGRGLESLQLVPTETNLGGTHQIALFRYIYQPESQAIALGYRIPRLAGRRIALAAESGIIWSRRGEPEGSSGSLTVAQPLYSARTEWAWAAGSLWRNEIVRRYQDAQLYYDRNGVPWQYRAERSAVGANVTRSFGWAVKNDFTLGAEMNLRAYHPPEVSVREERSIATAAAQDYPVPPSRLPSAAAVAAFTRANVPTSDRRVGPFVQYRAYTSNYLRVLDVETLGLQEDFRIGHDFALRVYPIRQELGSSRTFWGTFAAAQYTVGLGDGFARASVQHIAEADTNSIFDAAIDFDLRIVTPRLGVGRLVFDAGALNRYRNYLNRTSYVGGSGRLRGYPSNYFSGKDVVVYNFEFRSHPVEILSCQLGGAAFFDAGDAASGMSRLRPKHSVGLGFRVLFPQLDRLVFRGDVGFPLDQRGDPTVRPFSFTVAFEQAFALPSLSGAVSSSAATGWLGQ